MKEEGYVIVISPEKEGGYGSETYRLDNAGLMAVVAMLEKPDPSFEVIVQANHLNVRAQPAGEAVGMLDKGELVRVYPPTVLHKMGVTVYEWGRIETPLKGWIALGEGLAERVHQE